MVFRYIKHFALGKAYENEPIFGILSPEKVIKSQHDCGDLYKNYRIQEAVADKIPASVIQAISSLCSSTKNR